MVDFNPVNIFHLDDVRIEDVPITALAEAEYNRFASAIGVLVAMNRSAAMIEFDLQGNIITANEHFLSAMEYSLDEVQGHHHRMFCPSGYANSPAYSDFWRRLNQGEHFSEDCLRVKKSGEEIWIRATYNPVYESHRLIKVVKVAADITHEKLIQIRTQNAMKHLRDLRMAEISSGALEAIAESSKTMGKLVTMIEEIAGRSNLLGINAEIEASQAGEAGRGFSVVAREMRRLAENSAQTADAIGDLIKKASDVIGDGRAQISAVAERAADLIQAVVVLQQAQTAENAKEARAAEKLLIRLERELAA